MASFEDDLAIEAWARRTYALGTAVDPDKALANTEPIEQLAMRTPSAFARALLYNNLGSVELNRGRRVEARTYYDRALRESRTISGRGAIELIGIRANLALVTEDRAQADRLLMEAVNDQEQQIGADHPQTLNLREMRGFATIENVGQADAFLASVCQGYELHPALADGAAACWLEVGLLRLDQGQRDRAIEAMLRATRASSDAAEAAAYLTLLRGEPRRAAGQFADAVAALSRQAGEQDGVLVERSALDLGLGRARHDAGDQRGARTALDNAITVLEPLVRTHASARLERLLGRAQVALTLTLRAMNATSAELATVEASAAAWRQRVGIAARDR
jgi:tetratricopeptide (TPR) repeat protein